MLARELGSGAFSVVKLGVNLVSPSSVCICLYAAHISTLSLSDSLLLSLLLTSHHLSILFSLTGDGSEDRSKGGLQEETVGRGLRLAADGDRDTHPARPPTYNKVCIYVCMYERGSVDMYACQLILCLYDNLVFFSFQY